MPTIDQAVAQRYSEAFAQHEATRPRSLQMALGPSELGGCREYVRNVLAQTPTLPPTSWPSAAAVGTMIGNYVETIADNKFGAVIEVKVTTVLPDGLTVAGHADIVEVQENRVIDVKSKDGLDGIRAEGVSLENAIQVSIYALGLVQAGVLEEGATATLLYVDRSGRELEPFAYTLSWEEINNFITILMDRLADVVHAQEQISIGEMESAHHLRDKAPSFCYSPKVECPFREACWKGSDFHPTGDNVVTDPDMIELVQKYDNARARNKASKEEQDALRVSIKDLDLGGKLVGDFSVTFRPTSYGGEALYLTKAKAKPISKRPPKTEVAASEHGAV